jgi:uncharacterized protein (DUF305 family)
VERKALEMKMPSTKLLRTKAKKLGKKAMAIYLANPQDSNVNEVLYEAYLTEEDYNRVRDLMSEIINSRKKNISQMSVTY